MLLHNLLGAQRNNFRFVEAVLGGLRGAQMALHAELVLRLARHTSGFCRVIRRKTHAPFFKGACETVRGHVVNELGVAKANARANVREVRRKIHVLHAASHAALNIAGLNAGRHLHNGLQTRAADFVHSCCVERVGQTGFQASLTRRILSHACLQNATHDAFLNASFGGGHIGKRGGNCEGTKLRRRNFGQRTTKLSNGCATRGKDDGMVHEVLLRK